MKEPLEALSEMRKYGAVMTANCEIIEQALQDFQWLKSHICWDLLDHLNTEDKLKLLEIMGVNYD